MTSVEERLQTCQSALEKRGVKDVKFFFGSLDQKPFSELATDVAVVLEHVVAGNLKDFPPLND